MFSTPTKISFGLSNNKPSQVFSQVTTVLPLTFPLSLSLLISPLVRTCCWLFIELIVFNDYNPCSETTKQTSITTTEFDFKSGSSLVPRWSTLKFMRIERPFQSDLVEIDFYHFYHKPVLIMKFFPYQLIGIQ